MDKALESVKLNLYDILQIPGDSQSVTRHEPRIERMAKRIIIDYERHRGVIPNNKVEAELANIPSIGDGY